MDTLKLVGLIVGFFIVSGLLAAAWIAELLGYLP